MVFKPHNARYGVQYRTPLTFKSKRLPDKYYIQSRIYSRYQSKLDSDIRIGGYMTNRVLKLPERVTITGTYRTVGSPNSTGMW